MSLTTLKTIEQHNGFALLEVPVAPTPVWLIVPPGGAEVVDFSNENYRFYLDPAIARDAYGHMLKGVEPVGKHKGHRWADMQSFMVSH